MTEISFYHLTAQPATTALPMLMERALAAGMRALILCGSAKTMTLYDDALWTYSDKSFLPHDTEKSKNPAEQPLFLTTTLSNPNDATVLVLLDNCEAESFEGFKRVLEIFDGNNEEAVTKARTRWKKYKEEGHDLTYWQQSDAGAWSKK